jgi:hypothetical protein
MRSPFEILNLTCGNSRAGDQIYYGLCIYVVIYQSLHGLGVGRVAQSV